MKKINKVTSLLVVLGIVLVPVSTFAFTDTSGAGSTGGGVMCTMDAKICPDGSGVGRVPPSCEFAACPSSTQPSPGLPVATLPPPPPFGEIKRGVTSDKVKDLQTVLKSDPMIYSGPVTGYYGAMTEEAIKKLQAKFGLPQTGVLDAATQNIIIPYDTRVEVTVVTPNGGEQWKVGEIQKILWKAAFGPIPTPYPVPVPMMGSGSASTMTATSATMPAVKTIAPFFPRATLDLTRDSDPSFVVHIGTVNLYESSRVWKVPAGLPEAKDYRVRIAVGGETPCLYRAESEAAAQGRALDTSLVYPCPMMKAESTTGANAMMYPIYSTSDTSDNTFAILAGVVDNDRIEALKRQLASIQEMLTKIQEQVRLLNVEIQKLQGAVQ